MNYGTIGKVGFGLAGQKSHAKPLDALPSGSIVTSPLKSIGREQTGHFGHGLYMPAPWASCSRTQAVSRGEGIKDAPRRVPLSPEPYSVNYRDGRLCGCLIEAPLPCPLGEGGKTASEYLHPVHEIERRNLGAQSATDSGRCRRDG